REQNTYRTALLGQRNRHQQARPVRRACRLDAQAGLLLAQSFEPFRVALQHRPDLVQSASQVRAEGPIDRERPIGRGTLTQRVPGETQRPQALHVGPRLDGERRFRRLAVGRADAEDALAAAQLTYPGAVAAQVTGAGVAQAAGVRVDDAEDGQSSVTLT